MIGQPVVLVGSDDRGRTTVTWYEDETGFHNGDPLAEIVAARSFRAGRNVTVKTAVTVADTWILLLHVPSYDVSYLATHVEVDGVLTPVPGRAA